MLRKTKLFFTSYRSTPLILALLVVISYGMVVPFMGYFMDDWYLIWYKNVLGAQQYITYFSSDRPLMGYFFVAANFLLRNSESALVWQIFGLFTRWLSVYSLWAFLNTLWPEAKKQNTLVALLAAVFPGFTQQWIAVVYSFFFSCLAGFFFSLTLMLKAIRTPKRFWVYSILSFVIGVYSYAAAEFYYGLELIRPIVLWIEYSRSISIKRQRLGRTAKTWLPYLLAYAAYTLWRGFFFVSKNHSVVITSELASNPVKVLTDAIGKIYQAGVDAVGNAWVNPLNLANYPSGGKVPLLILGVILIVIVCLILWLNHLNQPNTTEPVQENSIWTREAFWLGLISLIVAILPFLAANLPVDYVYPYDRFMLAYLFGSSLLVVCLCDKRKLGMFAVVFLVAVSCGYQFTNGIRYKNMWQQQSDFFWQLSWRAPALEEGTVLITEDLPFSKYFSATSLTAPLNMIYNEDQDSREFSYLLALYSLNEEFIPSYEPDQPILFNLRDMIFSSDTSSLLVFRKPADGCLRILTPEDSAEEFVGKPEYEFWSAAIPHSNLDLVNEAPETAVVPPQRFFGKENTNQWCYYFEKADLARQQQNWQQTIQWYAEAEAKGFSALVDEEWLPLIDAYLNVGEAGKALAITQSITDLEPGNTASFCNLWKRQAADPQLTEEALLYLGCTE